MSTTLLNTSAVLWFWLFVSKFLTKDLGFEKRNTVDLFGSNHTKNSKHGKTSILNFDVEGTQLFGGLVIHGDTEVSGTKVTGLLALALLDGNLVNTNHNGNLDPSQKWDSFQGTKTIGDIGEFQVHGRRQVSIEMDVLDGKLSQGSSHGNTSVLQLDRTVVEEVIFGGTVRTILNKSKGIEESNRGKNTNLLIGGNVKSRLSGSLTGGGKGRSRSSEEKSKD
mmetsp:Transcript_3035/g.4434  ORF Transcript_3035/g.4434 Transcript_3035/m.4434 type:complete len:222 (-) Transcript_3035:165-830(-)